MYTFSSAFIMYDHLQKKGNTMGGAERLWLFNRKIKSKYYCKTQAPATTFHGFGPGQAEQHCTLGAYLATPLCFLYVVFIRKMPQMMGNPFPVFANSVSYLLCEQSSIWKDVLAIWLQFSPHLVFIYSPSLFCGYFSRKTNKIWCDIDHQWDNIFNMIW